MSEAMQEMPTTALAVPGEPGLSPETLAALEAGIPENTRRGYASDWRQFTAWCERTGRVPLPASDETLTEYTRYQAYEWVPERHAWKYAPGDGRPRGMAPPSIERARAAVIKMHRLAGLEPPATAGAVLILRGYRAALARARDSRSRVTKATPAGPDVLRQLVDAAGGSSARGLRDAAMFLLAYSTGARSVELVRLNIEDVAFTPEGLEVTVYRCKIRQFDDVAVPAADAPQTVRAVREWVDALAAMGRTTGPLFIRLGNGGPAGDPQGRFGPEMVTRILRACAEAAGLEGRWTSHSFRRGMATSTARAGASRKMIALQGGWDEDGRSLSGYIQAADKWTGNALKGAGV